ncbi:MAG: PepSY domain-containing protein [Chromatiaceae bacterium]|nr:PepSY domain-containing protein [Chromatiaceae bacterium]
MGRLTPLLLMALTLAAALPAAASDDDRSWRERGEAEALPLAELLQRADLGPGARVLEVEGKRKRGRALYEIEYVDGTGRIYEVLIDAVTGEVLRREEED